MGELSAAKAEFAFTQRQIETRKATERAKGILMRRTRCSETEALAMLEHASELEGVPLPELSRSVVASEPNPRRARI
jgi:AmiR/NasT family two-component response regulator